MGLWGSLRRTITELGDDGGEMLTNGLVKEGRLHQIRSME